MRNFLQKFDILRIFSKKTILIISEEISNIILLKTKSSIISLKINEMLSSERKLRKKDRKRAFFWQK